MNPHFTYLAVDLLAIGVPLIASFHPRVKFYRHFPVVLVSILFAALPFIPADHLFTHLKIWGFNPAYTTGIYIGNLPLEEYLFFLCIPFSCLFTFYCFRIFNIQWLSDKNGNKLAVVLAVLLMMTGLLFLKQRYTSTTFIATSLAIFAIRKWNPEFSFGLFFSAFSVLLIPFFICNGILTGTGLSEPVVWYNDAENFGFRMGTIPFEDTFYGMLLILLSCWAFQRLTRGK